MDDRKESGPGARLRTSRERRGLSEREIARSLRLDTRVIEALESDDYPGLPAPIFVRGYLNAYSKLLGLAPEEIIASYERAVGDTPPPRLSVGVGTGGQVTSSHTRIVIVSWIVILLAMSMVVSWWMSRPGHEAVETEVPQAVEQVRVAPVLPVVPAPGGEPVAEESPSVEAEPAAPPVGWVQVTVTYTEDCWTEITTIEGRRLFFDLARAGQTLELEGRGPLTVFLGNSPAARFEVDGRHFDHTRYTRAGNIARFSIETERSP